MQYTTCTQKDTLYITTPTPHITTTPSRPAVYVHYTPLHAATQPPMSDPCPMPILSLSPLLSPLTAPARRATCAASRGRNAQEGERQGHGHRRDTDSDTRTAQMHARGRSKRGRCPGMRSGESAESGEHRKCMHLGQVQIILFLGSCPYRRRLRSHLYACYKCVYIYIYI